MENISIAKQILESLLETPVNIIRPNDFDAFLKSFERTHCFSPELQPMYTASYLREFIQKMDSDTVYEIHEPLKMIAILFFLKGSLVIVGPYTDTEWNTQESESLLVGLGIPISCCQPYKLYRCQYRVLDSELILRAVTVLLEIAGLAISDYSYLTVHNDGKRMNVKNIPYQDQYTDEYIDRRYAAEKKFMQVLQTGNALEAKAAFKKMTSIPSQGLGFIKAPMWNQTIGTTILRTVIRIAATQSGLAPIIVDAISRDYAQKLYNSSFAGQKQTDELTLELIDEICGQIEKFHTKQMKYSSVVRKAIYFIQLYLGDTLSLRSIAAKLHVPTNRLSKQFKSETGMTITNYIIEERTKKAAELLMSTKHSVQDISASVGYMDNNYFVKVFKSRYGMTPTAYRKKYTV